MSAKSRYSFTYKNSLSLAFLFLFILSLLGQAYTGWNEYNEFRQEHNESPVTLLNYFHSGHFLQSTFENWESEFFQMALFVWLTVFLRQIGSSESKKIGGKEEVDRKPKNRPGAPWPVRKGGFILKVYKHSLSLSLLLLFVISFVMHWYGSNKDFNENRLLQGKTPEGMLAYLSHSRFWFESFQNWQSEFLSVFAIIFLSIYLRELGSPQSKPVDAPHWETGE